MITIIIIFAVLVYVAIAGVIEVIKDSKELSALRRGFRFHKNHQSNLEFRSRQLDEKGSYLNKQSEKQRQQRAAKDKYLNDQTRKMEKRAREVMENMDWTDE